MAVKPRETRSVETLRAFDVTPDGPTIHPGQRVWAWASKNGWNVIFNGVDVPIENDVVGDLDHPAVQQAAGERKALLDAEAAAAVVPGAMVDALPMFSDEEDWVDDFEGVDPIDPDEDTPA